MPKHKDLSAVKYLYLTTTGRITGLPREIEIWFVEAEGKFYILAEHFHKTQWIKNILHNPRVSVRIEDQIYEATARVLNEEKDKEMWQLAQNLEREKYNWGDGLPVELTLSREGDDWQNE